jgi:SulP family sulfate permease
VNGFLHGLRTEDIRFDVLAGLTTAAVVIPKSMAFATIAGLPVQVGLYVAVVPLFVYAVLGTSRQLSVSTTTTLAILTASQLAHAVPDGDPARMMAAASALALLTGGFLFLAGILRLGFVANFISDPVLSGFKAGIGLVIVVDQLPKLLGVHIDKSGFFRNLLAIVEQVPHANLPTLVLAVLMVGILLGLGRFTPRMPAPLVAAAAFFGLKSAGIALTGTVPAGLPVPALPDFKLFGDLWVGALGIALMSFTESIAAGRAFVRHNDPYPVPNRELIALGAANIAGSFFHIFPAGGGTSQTAVNFSAGARSQFAGLVTLGTVIATLLFLSPLISLLPQATLAAIVVVTSLPLLNPADFRSILQVRRMEFLWAVIACAGVVLLGTLEGILVAIAISVLMLLYQSTHPPVYVVGRKPGTEIFRPLTGEHPEDESIPGLLIVRTEGRMNFASAPQVGVLMRPLIEQSGAKVVILEMSAIPDLEYTALRALTSAEASLHSSGVTLWLAGPNPEVFRVIERSPLGEALGHTRIFVNLREAVHAYETKRNTP